MLAYVVFAVVVDPESAEFEEPFMLMADGQRDFVTRGLVEQARDVVVADSVGAIAYVSLDEDDDE